MKGAVSRCLSILNRYMVKKRTGRFVSDDLESW